MVHAEGKRPAPELSRTLQVVGMLALLTLIALLMPSSESATGARRTQASSEPLGEGFTRHSGGYRPPRGTRIIDADAA